MSEPRCTTTAPAQRAYRRAKGFSAVAPGPRIVRWYFIGQQMRTTAAAKPDAAPAPSAQRGPNAPATQLTMAVPPRARARMLAIARPRMTGSVDRCTAPFVAVVNACADTPMKARPKSR